MMRRRLLVALALLALPAASAADPAPPLAAAAPSPPRGSRAQGGPDARGVQRFTSGAGLRPTCKHLAAQAIPGVSRYVPMARARSMQLCRLVSDDPRTSWAAVHAYQPSRDGKTRPTIAIVPRTAPASAPSP